MPRRRCRCSVGAARVCFFFKSDRVQLFSKRGHKQDQYGRNSFDNIANIWRACGLAKPFAYREGDGECFTLIGPSGCGKTVLLRIIAGFESLDQGSMSIGSDVAADAGTGDSLPPEQRGLGLFFRTMPCGRT